MTNGKINVLIIMGRYLPGYKDGGPVRTIKNLTDYLGSEFNFKILTCDRDHGDDDRYPNIKVNSWNHVGKADVYYVPPGQFTIKTIVNLSKTADMVYVCGCFSDYAINTLIAYRLGKIKVPVAVAAMGLFSPLEFKLKYWKKKTFITLFNITGMFRKIIWSASSNLEVTEIKKQVWAKDHQFMIAEDLPRRIDCTALLKKKKEGCLNVVWISRIAPKKNLVGAIQSLQDVQSKIHFSIYGPIHNNEYWEKCKIELQKLPHNVQWEYMGNIESEYVIETLREHHVFLFPTFGENYGHVIMEALSAGCPCIISDQTLWKDLQANEAGVEYSLSRMDQFSQAVDHYASMTEEQFSISANKALKYICDKCSISARDTGYRKIFDGLMKKDGLS